MPLNIAHITLLINGTWIIAQMLWLHTSTKNAVETMDLRRKRATATAAKATPILAIGRGTASCHMQDGENQFNFKAHQVKYESFFLSAIFSWELRIWWIKHKGYILGQDYFLRPEHHYQHSMPFVQLLSFMQSVKENIKISFFDNQNNQSTI